MTYDENIWYLRQRHIPIWSTDRASTPAGPDAGPCPFCGAEVADTGTQVICQGCGASAPVEGTQR